MTETPFGEGITIDPTNRMDISKNNVPEYVQFGRTLRAKLKESVEKEGFPASPQIHSVEDFFNGANDAVTQRWNQWTGKLIKEKCLEWSASLPESEEYQSVAAILSDPHVIEEKLRIRQFGVLEPLRKANPVAWGSLLAASSERQLAAISIARYWLNEIPEDDFTKMGMTKTELQLFVDIAGTLGKYVDHAYMKQVEMADAPGGSVSTPLGDEKGAKHVYDITKPSGGVDLKTYADMFPFEWPRIIAGLHTLSLETQEMVDNAALPQTYQFLPSYLEQMVATYGSSETSPNTLDQLWQDLDEQSTKLSESGCPIAIHAQKSPAVAADANKVDVEIRLGLRTPAVVKLEKECNVFTQIGQQIVDGYANSLHEPYKLPTMLLDYQAYAFGPNLYWMTRGEEGKRNMVSHVNAVTNVAQTTEVPLLQKFLSGGNVSVEQYKKGALVETVLHEEAHVVLSPDDKAVGKRVGIGPDRDVVEELKADTVSAALLDEALNRGDLSINPELQLLAKIGSSLDYVVNKSSGYGTSGERYYYAGIDNLHTLLTADGVLEKVGGGYRILDARKGIAALAQRGRQILALYADENTQPDDIKRYAQEIREKKKDARVIDCLVGLKN